MSTITVQDALTGKFPSMSEVSRPDQYALVMELEKELRTRILNKDECLHLATLMNQLCSIPRMIVWCALNTRFENLSNVHTLVEHALIGDLAEKTSRIELDEFMKYPRWQDAAAHEETLRKYGYIL